MSRTILEVSIGGKVAKRLDLADDGLVVGSDAAVAGLAISDPALAARHVRIQAHGDDLVLVTPLGEAPVRVGRETISVESFVRMGQRLRLSDAVEIGLLEAPSKAKKGQSRKGFFASMSTPSKVGLGAYLSIILAIAVFFGTREAVETFEPGSAWAEANVLSAEALANCASGSRRIGPASLENTITQILLRALDAERTGALPDAVRDYERILAIGLAPTDCMAIRYAADRRSQIQALTRKTRVVQ